MEASADQSASRVEYPFTHGPTRHSGEGASGVVWKVNNFLALVGRVLIWSNNAEVDLNWFSQPCDQIRTRSSI